MLAITVRNKVIENQVSPKCEKATILMNEIEYTFWATKEENLVKKFQKLCDVLRNQNSQDLTILVDKMMNSSV